MNVEHEMVRIGRIIAADQGLKVHVRGTQAFASPGQVTIPNIDHYEWLGARDGYRMLHGLLDHECAHALYSDFGALKEWREKNRPCAALSDLQNVLEDAYIERLMGRRYRGSGTNIHLMNEWFFSRTKEERSGETLVREGDLWSAFLVAVGTVTNEHGHRSIESYKALRPEVHAMLELVEPEIGALVALAAPKATWSVIRIATRVFEKLRAAAKEQPKSAPSKPEPPESEDEKEPATQDSEEDGDEDSDADDESGGPTEAGEDGAGGKPEDATDDEGTESESGTPGKKESEESDGEAEGASPPITVMDLDRWTRLSPLRPTEAIDVIIRSVFEQPSTVQPYTIFSHEFDIERDFTAERQDALSDAYEQAKDVARAITDSLILAFEVGLKARDQQRPIGGNDEGDVDPQALVEFGVGALPADQLYVQYVEDDSTNVAVSVLCDCSGSMGGRKAQLCQQAAIAMHEALAQVQIDHEITGFTTIESSSTNAHRWARGMEAEYNANFLRMRAALRAAEEQGTQVGLFARELHGSSSAGKASLMVPFHAVFKRFGDSDARALMHIAGISQNLDGEAVLWQAQRLARRPERRKVMFVLSDGCPVGSRDNAQGARYLKENIDRIVAAGIEVYGIGIASHHVADYYPLWWYCNSPEDLIRVAVEGLTDVLVRRRVERDFVSL